MTPSKLAYQKIPQKILRERSIRPLEQNGFIMAKKKELTTFSYPSHMVTEYLQLMNSKEGFSKKISSAEAHKLESLYEQLKEYWKLNITKDLKEILDQKYAELREIQSEIKGDWKNYGRITAQKELQNIRNEEDYLNENKLSFKSTLKDWKNDILEKEENLWMKKLELKQKSQKLNSNSKELSPEQKELARLLREKERLSIELKSISKTYDSNLTDYQNDIDSMESELENELESKKIKLTQIQKEYSDLLTPHQKFLEMKKKDWKESMIPTEQELITKSTKLEKRKEELNASITSLENELKASMQELEKEYLKTSLKEAIKEVGGLPRNMQGWEDLKPPSWLTKKLESSMIDFEKLINWELLRLGKTEVEMRQLLGV